MNRNAYNAERQQVYRWRRRVLFHLVSLDALLARRPQGKDAKYGELPELPDAILEAWELPSYCDRCGFLIPPASIGCANCD